MRPKPTRPSLEPARSCPSWRPRPDAVPAPVTDEPIAGHEEPPAGEHQRERELGDGRVEDAGRVRHRDPACATGGNVDVVVADAVVRDESEIGEEVELVRPDANDGLEQDLDAR
jgi:hypothetical protein